MDKAIGEEVEIFEEEPSMQGQIVEEVQDEGFSLVIIKDGQIVDNSAVIIRQGMRDEIRDINRRVNDVNNPNNLNRLIKNPYNRLNIIQSIKQNTKSTNSFQQPIFSNSSS